MLEMTPRKIVAELDKFIIGQEAAKRAVAIAVRNRWRRQMVDPEIKKEIGPKNMMMIGPTGVGKTEIARRLASLTGAPFIKVEATKYTEVGYYGRDVESMVRELVENAIGIVRTEERKIIASKAESLAEDRLISLIEEALLNKRSEEIYEKKKTPALKKEPEPQNSNINNNPCFPNDVMQILGSEELKNVKIDPKTNLPDFNDLMQKVGIIMSKRQNTDGTNSDSTLTEKSSANALDDAPDNAEKEIFLKGSETENCYNENDSNDRSENNEEEFKTDREEIRRRLRAGEYDELEVALIQEQKMPPMIMGGIGIDSMENDLSNMFENIMPKKSSKRELSVLEARKILVEQECENLINKEKLHSQAVELAENLGIIFIDEIDKIVASDQQHGADVSRQGVQRDLLPIVEGTTIHTKYGFVSTEHILFIAAGAFHRSKPNDLMPELQGRFPIRVELTDLTQNDFVRILKEPHGSLTRQYTALMKTEGINLSFTDDAIEELARCAFEVNQTTQNIGARRLCTIMERLLEELSFEAADMGRGNVVVNAAYVNQRLGDVVQDEDLSKFIL